MAAANYLSAMGELLGFFRVVGSPAEVTSNSLEALVTDFQMSRGLLADGIPGEETLWNLQRPWVEAQPKLMLRRCQADKPEGVDGFTSLILREDAADRFDALATEVRSFGGVVTTAGGVRELSVGANPHRSSKSMHYPGIAFDLALTSGFFKPMTDPFVVTRGEDTYWNVWARAEGGDDVELKTTYWDGWNAGKDRTKTVRGRFVDFTSICKKHGFHPIGPRSAYRRPENKQYLSSEWWHFQANDLLIPDLSQLGIELLKIQGYTQEKIEGENHGVWQNRKSRYGKSWF